MSRDPRIGCTVIHAEGITQVELVDRLGRPSARREPRRTVARTRELSRYERWTVAKHGEIRVRCVGTRASDVHRRLPHELCPLWRDCITRVSGCARETETGSERESRNGTRSRLSSGNEKHVFTPRGLA